MSKIARYAGNLRAFASEAQGLERTLFGETAQADDLTAQVTASFLRGWGIVGPSEHPSLEDFNAAMYTMSQFIAYQHQMGVPEWHEEQEYYIGSICTHGGESYQSLVNSNLGNEPPSAQWTPILTSKNGLKNLGLGDLGTAAKRNVGTGINQIPDMSSFGAQLAQNGYFSLPGGVVVQYGQWSWTGNNVTANVTLPTAFPNQLLWGMAAFNGSQGGTPDNVYVSGGNRGVITLTHAGDNGAGNARWICVGN